MTAPAQGEETKDVTSVQGVLFRLKDFFSSAGGKRGSGVNPRGWPGGGGFYIRSPKKL